MSSAALDWSVRGGEAGVRAAHEDLLRLADLLAGIAEQCWSWARSLERLAVAPALGVAAPLAPVSAARVGAEVLQALRLLLHCALEARTLAGRLRAGVATYRAADGLLTSTVQSLQVAAGAALGTSAPLLLPPLGVVAGSLQLAGADPQEQLEAWVVHHPEELGFLAGGAAGVWRGVAAALLVPPWAPGPLTYAGTMHLLGAWLPEGAARAEQIAGPTRVAAPQGAGDLLRAVEASGGDGAVPGEIGILRLHGSDGVERYVVLLPGTASWALRPGQEPRDLAGNLHLSAEEETAYAAGVVLALTQARVPPGAPVLLVGHSQGGMVAARLAADPAVRSAFSIRAVLSAGAPLGRAASMPGVAGLALENTTDLVPTLEGRANPDSPGLTTARFTVQHGSVVGNHDVGTYAAAVDALPLGHPSVQGWRREVAGFLDPAATAEQERWAVTRVVARRPA